MKKTIIAIVAIVVIIGGGLFYALSNLDGIVKTAIEKGGSKVTGVGVSLDNVKIDLTSAKAILSGFMVKNPDGFDTDYVMALDAISVEIDKSSIGSDVIIIKSVNINAPKIIYELGAGGSNIDAIQKNVERFTGGSDNGSNSNSSDGGDVKIIIKNLIIENGEIGISAGFLAGKKMSLPLPKIHLRDIGKDGDKSGASPAEIAAKIMTALNDKILGSVSKINLSGMSKKADKLLKSIGGSVTGNATDAAAKAGETIGDGANDAADKAKSAVKGVTGAIGNLFGD